MKPLAVLLLTLLVGCQRETDDMGRQARHDPADTSPLFADGRAERLPPPGSEVHARGDLALLSSGRLGEISPSTSTPRPAATPALLQRGRQRYTIYCLPCHGDTGAGDGEVVRRGFPAPPDLRQLRRASDASLYAAIRQGVGRMAPFADRVGRDDAWAIVAYLRELQRGPTP